MALLPHQINLILRLKQDPFDSKFQSNEPVEYILGKAEFRGDIFTVNRSVLIPRIETEEIIDLALSQLDSSGIISGTSEIKFADVATGSGAIGISFSKELLKRSIQYRGYMSDVSEDALVVAKTNVDGLIGDSNIEILKSDLLNSYPKDIKFDVIFANLPYIPTTRLRTLDSSVKDYEPILALDGGVDGLMLFKRILIEASAFLEPNGVLLLEVDDTHDQSVAKDISIELDDDKNLEIKVVLDQFGKNRFWIVKY